MTHPLTLPHDLPMMVDGHLDLAMNVVDLDYDLTLPLDVLRQTPGADQVLVTLPELQRGHVGLAFATLFLMATRNIRPNSSLKLKHSYRTSDEAHQLALQQLEVYERWEAAGLVRIIRTRADLKTHIDTYPSSPTLGLLILMEGADPIRTPEEVPFWFERGVRLVGPAWKATRYAGGTGEPSPLSTEGEALITALEDTGIIIDLSHIAEESFWQVLDMSSAPVVATHSNARAIIKTDRQLSDAMVRAIGQRDGIIGLVLANHFLKHPLDPASPRDGVTLADVKAHAEHMANLIGWDHLAIGSDFDGGFGLDKVPQTLNSIADLHKLGTIVPPEAESQVLGNNWLRFLLKTLP